MQRPDCPLCEARGFIGSLHNQVVCPHWPDGEELRVERTLGVFYDTERESFFFYVNPDAEETTKRQM